MGLNKKIVGFLLLSVMLITACGRNYNKNDFSSTIETISWNMTMDDIVSKRGEPINTEELNGSTIITYNGSLDGCDGQYIYRFGTDNKLEFIKFRFDRDYEASSFCESLKEKFGEPDNTDEYEGCDWYGMVQGEKAVLAYIKDKMIEVDKVK